MASLPADVEKRIRAQLSDGEPVIWCGQPRAASLGPRRRRVGSLAIGLASITLPLSIFSCLGLGRLRPNDIRETLVRSAFVLGSLIAWGVVGALLYAAIFGRPPRERTWYVVTDRRALSWIDDPVPGVKVVEAPQLGKVAEIAESDGSLTLVIEALGHHRDVWPEFARVADLDGARAALATLAKKRLATAATAS